MSDLKILIVEQKSITGEKVKQIVQSAGYNTVENVANFEAVMQMKEEEQPDILLANRDAVQHHCKIDIPTIFFEYDEDSELRKRFKAVCITKPLIAIPLSDYLNKMKLDFKDSKKNSILNDTFFVRNRNKLDKVKVNDILWIQSDKKYCTIMTIHKKFVLRISLRGILEKLDNEQFIRVHRSYIVQLNAIESISLGENEISLQNYKIPMGKKYQEVLFQHLNLLQ